ncbi:MAG: hypothetical protein OQK82_04350 [Candidatus Pacearchaeota archaeon]|nr:hypothetical protein [Candidatus Pacearchaeota archaeon]
MRRSYLARFMRAFCLKYGCISMTEEDGELIPASTRTETALDVAAFVGSAVPWIGGPVSSVLGGMSLGRKLGRVREVLEGLSDDLVDLQSDVSENYVKTEEFEDILEQALRRVGEERSEEKRQLYRAFLSDAIASPGEPYDDQLRMLRTFEALAPDHLHVLKAIMQEPNPNPGSMGSPNQTLRERLPDFNESRIEELINHLNDMRVTNLGSLKVMMTGHGAQDLRHVITGYGQRIINYINEA